MNVIMLGPPGSGKGTQGAILAKRTGYPRVSTGDLLREAVAAGTSLGKRANSFMEKGLLVPDEVILALIEEVLGSPEASRGIIMDGFPRTIAQAEAVQALLAERGEGVDCVISLDVADEELVNRMEGRAQAEARADDTPEAFRRRLAVYRAQTSPLIDFYQAQGLLIEIPGIGTIDEVAERVAGAVET